VAAAIDERTREIDRSGKETEEAGGKSIEGREIDGQVEKSTARLAIWGERTREGERAHLELAAAATPPRVRRPRRERDSSAPSASRARILCAVLSASATPPAGPQAAPATGSSLFVASPQAPPSSLLVHLRRPAGSSLLVPLHLLSCSCIHVAVLLNSEAFSLIYFAVDFADWSFFV